MTAPQFDVAVVGGGPAGAAAAIAAKRSGASVVCIDKATFPRDKPCGDGITPRAVSLLHQMGITDPQLARFNRVTHITFTSGNRSWSRGWPERDGFPGYGYVAPRTSFDALLLQHAKDQGVEVMEGVRATGAVFDGETVRGVEVVGRDGSQQTISSAVVVGADGMSSRTARSVGLSPIPSRPCAITVRAQVEAHRGNEASLEIFPSIQHEGRSLPGYGWVFPMGSGRVNVGIGFVTTFANWREVRMLPLLEAFVRSLPESWGVPTAAEMKQAGALQGWKLPLGFAVEPLWKPGFLLVGDAAGVAKPYTGAGISKALQSGLLGGAAAADAAAGAGDYALEGYEANLRRLWGKYYRRGRLFNEMLGRPHLVRGVVGTAMRSPEFALRLFGMQRT